MGHSAAAEFHPGWCTLQIECQMAARGGGDAGAADSEGPAALPNRMMGQEESSALQNRMMAPDEPSRLRNRMMARARQQRVEPKARARRLESDDVLEQEEARQQ